MIDEKGGRENAKFVQNKFIWSFFVE